MTDLRHLRPIELCRLLNSGPLGEVVSDRQLRRHRTRAGLRLGSGQSVDLFRYLAWIADEVHKPREATGKDYLQRKADIANRARMLSEAGRDIGDLPPVADAPRKAAAERSFRAFCESYFDTVFNLGWSDDHLRVMGKIEQAVLEGGLFALAMPRGSGKTSLAECACLWAILYGHRDFVCLIGSDEAHAADMLDSLKTELETNDRLLEDFPEAVFPIQALDGIPHRAGGQLYHGERTHIGWTAKEIVMPTIPDSPASGAIIKVAGITGRIRGMKFKRPDGQAVRPSLVVLDDPQTDESARSVSQCQHREATLAGAVLGLAGPGRKIAGVMPCTVIRPGDMADRILDRELHPEWNGERTKMLYASPKATRLWERYAELRAESLRAGRGLELATQFYRDHRADMDAGARIAWPDRHNPDELSAIQHAMNLQLQDERAFWAEYQNEPLPDALAETDDLNVDVLLGRLNGYERRQIPTAAEHLTAFVDVQQKALFYVVCAWAADFSGWIIDYGTWPDQKRDYFTLRDLRSTLAMVAKGAGLEGSIYHGLEKLSADLMDRRWRRDDGAELSIDRLLIDANWGQSTDVVYQFCRASNYRANLLPSHGRYVGASSLPMSEQRRKRGDRVGLNWRLPGLTGRRAIRHVVFDANYWKSFIHARLCVAMGDPGGLSLWGRAGERHRRFAEHCCAEYRVRTAGRGREVDEWKLRPEGDDNHWFDGVVGCAVAASILGAAIPEVDGNGPAKDRKRIRLSSYKSSR